MTDILQHRRVNGRMPNLRECVEHFGGLALNVRMSLWELTPDQQRQLGEWGREEWERKSLNPRSNP